MSKYTAPEVFWAVALGTPTAVELWAVATKRTHWTLSPLLRHVARTHTKSGQALVTVGFGAGATWLAHHLIATPPL